MRLEGTLDAFSLPDIFQLLSFTKKTGALHLRRDAEHGVVHLRDGAVTGARSDVRREALARRLVGAGLLDAATLAAAADRARAEGCGVVRALAGSAAVAEEHLRTEAVEQATDAVFDLLRWPDGEFAFVVDEPDPDDVGAATPVEEVVAEAQRRMATWSGEAVPAPDAVVSVVVSPPADPVLTREEWALLAQVDGRRTFSELVALSGRGVYAVVQSLGALAERGLVGYGPATDAASAAMALLGELEGGPAPAPVTSAPPSATSAPPPAPPAPVEPPPAPAEPREQARVEAAVAAPPQAPAPVIPERPEPFTPTRRPDHAEPEPAYARAQRIAATVAAASEPAPVSRVGEVHGATAMQPAQPAQIERDPSVNKSLLLRLIAGVKGL